MTQDIEVMVHSLVRDMPISAMRQERIRVAAAEDPELQRVRRAVMLGWPIQKHSAPAVVQAFWQVKEDIHVAEGLLCVGERIIVPKMLRAEMLDLLHESHMGAEKTKARARAAIFWPNMADDIDRTVANCAVCLKHRNSNTKEPLKPHPVPELPWQKVGSDILTFQGKDFLLVVDYYSKYPEVVEIEQKTAATVILKLKEIFARHGIPEELMSDNMPFDSREFRQFPAVGESGSSHPVLVLPSPMDKASAAYRQSREC